MKNILWLSHLLPYPPKGGVLQRSYNLIKESSKRHKITLLAFNQKNLCPSEKDMQDGLDHLSQFCRVADVITIESEKSNTKRIKLLLAGLLPGKTYTVSWLASDEFKNALAKVLAANDFDLIHVDTLSLAPYVIDLKPYKKVLNHHNIESVMMLRRAENEKNFLKKIYFYQEGIKLKKYEKQICDKFELNITCSDLDATRLEEIAPGIRCEGVPNGVDLNYFSPQDLVKVDKSIVFAGGLSWYPNLDAMSFFLKSVWPRLNDEVPDVSMTIIGRSPPQWMRDMQNDYKNLTITGFVDDVRPYLARAYLYVCPIRDGGGTKLKVLDALAMGKLLVAHPIACEGIDVQDRENVLFATTPEEYIAVIKDAFANPVMAQDVARKGYQLIEQKYNFAAIGSHLSDLYQLVCEGPSTASKATE